LAGKDERKTQHCNEQPYLCSHRFL
jgi:hypothetical protein